MGKKYALIAGVSDYTKIGDLSFCDEDATDWYLYLKNRGYEITLLGDVHRGNYPKYDGLATEANVRFQLRRILQEAKSDDTVVFISAGHGSGDGQGNSYLCYVDCDPRADRDCYRDKELLADLQLAKARPKIFIFIDNCYSGGFLDELKSVPNVACFTTCTKKGYGYDYPERQNGAWTYTFLERGMIQQFGGSAPIETVFNWAKNNYFALTGNKGVGDIPQMINNLGKDFQL